MARDTKAVRGKKKERKNIAAGVAHVNSSFNNTKILISDVQGNASVLIVVSVTMDTINQIQSHLLAHQYEGLIEKSQLRGKKRSGSAPKAPARR